MKITGKEGFKLGSGGPQNLSVHLLASYTYKNKAFQAQCGPHKLLALL